MVVFSVAVEPTLSWIKHPYPQSMYVPDSMQPCLKPWTGIPNQLKKVVIIYDSHSLFHFPTLPYPPLLLIIFHTPGLVMSRGSASLTAFCVRGDGSASI